MNTEEAQLRIDLAAAYRLVSHFGWDDLIYTHLSARIPNTDTFLINDYGLRFDEVTASNLVKVDFQGNVIGEGNINIAGLVIHSAIHEVRHDVQCIIHTHTKEGVAVSADSRGLLPISQRSMVVLRSLAYHDYCGIVVDEEEKVTLTKDLGDKNFLILKNHGLLTVGNSVASAFMNMFYLQKSCEIQCITDLSHAIIINNTVSDNINNQIKKFNTKTSSTILAWNALLRLLNDSYKY
jgi:ribulose-5-phosphate 4-epimerase/fuculose-1-phosphate aldolase